jgi:2-amino-4-hydroxy-6-hydroxymethyldihydropteridine diphosphokinase
VTPPAAVAAYVGLGGNVGDVAATLHSALDALDRLPGTRLVRCSRLYRTPPWGQPDQPPFLNAVAELSTTLAPPDLLAAMLRIECAHGRTRDPAASRWGPRTLDLDLLLHGTGSLDIDGLRLPHPRLRERAFVLVPLAEIAPDLPLPGGGTVSSALAAVAVDGIEALP